MTITWGSCGHPLRDRSARRRKSAWADDEAGTLAVVAHVPVCRVCDLLDRTDGEGVLRHPPATSWRGREDEANAWEDVPADQQEAQRMPLGDLDTEGAYDEWRELVMYIVAQGSMYLDPWRMRALFGRVPEQAFSAGPPPRYDPATGVRACER